MNQSVDASRNHMMILNVMRARYSHPLTFLSVTSLSGSQGGGGNLGLPTITFGPQQTALQRQFVFGNNSLAATINGNITAAPLESREFYQGLLQPVDLGAVRFLLAQGYPRQILFLLLVDSVRLRTGGRERSLFNDPLDTTYPEFERWLRRLVAAGVTVESSGTSSEPPRICVDQGAVAVPLAGLSPACGARGLRTGSLYGLSDHGANPVEIRINVRSTYGIFRYLGRLTDPEIGSLVRLDGDRVGDVRLGDDRRLFPVVYSEGSECLTSASYYGSTVCLPAIGAEQAAIILQLLTQLVALNISVKDLPAVPTIRLVN